MTNETDNLTKDWSDDHRSGVIAVAGRPNVGKSTLINQILGQKIAITTPKPQTTRRNQLGILTIPEAQALLVDTPGLHDPHTKLGELMKSVAEAAIRDADVVIFIVDASAPLQDQDRAIAERVRHLAGSTPVVLVLNKIDRIRQDADLDAHRNLVDYESAHNISALTGDGVARLSQHVIGLLPVGPRYYPPDQVSDVSMRFIAAEIVREQIMMHTEKEIPHAVAVEIESYREEETRTVISAMIYVERDSQKGIVIGKGGQMIKRIGTEARKVLIEQLEQAVHLELRVKVLKNWRSNEEFMRRVGYRVPRRDED